ncbi:MAG: heavy metal-associated domain-containing protein [Deferrisomatales bacterium]|nr:heavy metal-associated domain-containing protein [Deferrisomatales bacterium]
MRRTLAILITSLTLGALLLWGVDRVATGAATAETVIEAGVGTDAGTGTAAELTLAVSGMTCGSCEGRIRDALEARPGVRQVAVDLGSRTVRVVYDPAKEDPKALAEVVTAAGYPARYLPPGTALPTAPRSGGGCGGGCCGNQG